MEFSAHFTIYTEDGTQEQVITFGDDAWQCQVCFEWDILGEFEVDSAELTGISLSGYDTIAQVKTYTWDLSPLGNDIVTRWEELWDWCEAFKSKIDEAVDSFWNYLNDSHIEG